MQIPQLNLRPQSVSRPEHPRICLDIEFDLDAASCEALIREATQSEPEAFTEVIENAVCIAAYKVPAKELLSGELAPYTRLVIDPTSKYVFGFQMVKGEGNKLIVKRAEVKAKPGELILAKKLTSTPIKVLLGSDKKPVIITFYLEKKAISHLNRVELRLEDKEQADDLRLSIQRAISTWVFENYDTKITEEETARYIEIAEDPISKKSFGFVIYVIDRNNIEISNVKVPNG